MNAINPTISAALKGVVPDALLFTEEQLLAADVHRMNSREARERAAEHRALQAQVQHMSYTGQMR